MKTLILLTSVLFSLNSFSADYKACVCNFNNCWDEKKPSCTQIIRCEKISENKFYSIVDNSRQTALRLNKTMLCVNFTANYMTE